MDKILIFERSNQPKSLLEDIRYLVKRKNFATIGELVMSNHNQEFRVRTGINLDYLEMKEICDKITNFIELGEDGLYDPTTLEEIRE